MYLYTNKTEIITLEEKLPSEGYEIVKTFVELNGKNWLLYNTKQAEFYKENPEATPEEVFNMEIVVYDAVANMSRKELLDAIKNYINNFVDQQILSGFIWNGMPV